jgi:flagellar L-ring protein precursor FlgH
VTIRTAPALATVALCAFAAALVLALTGCGGVSHVGGYKPKSRAVPVPESAAPGGEGGSAGSLYRDGLAASNLYTDARALRENDLVVVKVEEIADARRSADTDLTHNSQTEAAITAFLQATKQNVGITGKNNQTFHGNGATARTERLTATVPAVVKKVMANGNLFIEGHRVVLVNAEEQHFYISGVVRPIDIDQENSVKSAVVAEAEVEFTGRGVLTDNQRQGWLGRFFNLIWPF